MKIENISDKCIYHIYIYLFIGLLQGYREYYRRECSNSNRRSCCSGLHRTPGHYFGAVSCLLLLASTTW